MRLQRSAQIAFCVLALMLSAASVASAANGVATGRLRFYNNQGNYCPNTRDCTAARYTQAQFNTNRSIRDVKVYLVTSGGTTIGQGTTDSNGDFTIGWYKFTYPWQSQNVSAHIEWYGEHRDNRFMLRTSQGGKWVFSTSNRTLNGGTTSAGPQSLGTFTWGSSSSPNSLANLYDGAVRMWRDALNSSNRMRNNFNNVEIRSYDSASCPTSCANGATNRIIIDSSASAFRPQARIMHEMGHIASYVSAPFASCSDYSRDGASTGWSMTSAEFACASFEEGLATFFGDRAIYWQASPQPTSCLSAGVCSTSVENRGAGSCQAGENRWALTVDRYLRDLYDSTNEATDSNRNSYFRFFDTLARFGTGTGNGQRDEAWAWTGWFTYDRDGRSARDYRRHFEDLTGQNTSSNYSANCSPVGD